jgi:hypothetical protein
MGHAVSNKVRTSTYCMHIHPSAAMRKWNPTRGKVSSSGREGEGEGGAFARAQAPAGLRGVGEWEKAEGRPTDLLTH